MGLHWYIMLPLCILGVVIGDGFLYGIGRIWGTAAGKPVDQARGARGQAKIEENFRRYGCGCCCSLTFAHHSQPITSWRA